MLENKSEIAYTKAKKKKKKGANNRDGTITLINAGSLTLADLFLSQIRSREREIYNQSSKGGQSSHYRGTKDTQNIY